MKRLLSVTLSLLLASGFAQANDTPLRIFIRSGAKTHGPGAHDHPAFLRDWIPLLNERGASAKGGDSMPSQQELETTDVLILHRDGGGDFTPEEKERLNAYTKRGGGIVVIHAGSVSNTPEGTDYYKGLIGGSWRKGTTKWLEGPMNLYFTDRLNLITKDCSNFEMKDEIYYDMDLSPDIHVLAGAYTPKPVVHNEKAAKRAEASTGGGKKVSVYDIQPQLWTYEKEQYRAFVSVPGHNYVNFSRPNFRALLLRGIAWAGKRSNVDELCTTEELGDNLRYVEGGPTRPEKAREKLEVHPDFELSLVASEPLVNKVLNVDWDARGRLWVCETPEYPNGRRNQNTNPWKDSGSLLPGQFDREAQDRISWLEDTNGDGVMDKKHVFADKLELVTSFVFHKNGVIACAAPDIWLLEDTRGTGVCDKRTKLYTGLGDRDTHAVMSNLRWGLDGWIYATNGYSTSARVTNGDGTRDFGGYSAGVVRFKPDGSAFEQFSSKGSNTWGLAMTWDGQCFFTQPTCSDVLMHVALPESILARGKAPGTNSYNVLIKGQRTFPLMKWEQQAYVQIDQVGYYTAAAGCAIYEGGAWPDKWKYSYFTSEPTINLVSQFHVTPDGVSYKAEKEKGREETEFIRSKDLWFRPVDARVGPDGALYVVDFYNQAVIHNDTRGPLHGPANAAVRPDRDHYFSRIWRVQHKQAKQIQVPVLQPDNLAGLLNVVQTSPNAHTKFNALRLIRENHSADAVASALKQPNGSKASGIYEAALKTADNAAGQKALLAQYAEAKDLWTRSAIIAAASDHALELIGQIFSSPAPSGLESLLLALVPPALKQEGAVASLLTLAASAPATTDSLKNALLTGLAASGTAGPTMNDSTLGALRKLLATPATASSALPLVARWDKDGVLTESLNAQVELLLIQLSDSKAAPAIRNQAATSLLSVSQSNPKVFPALSKALTEDTSEEFRGLLLDTLGSGTGEETGQLILSAFAQLTPKLQSIAFNQLLKRPEWSSALLGAIRKGSIPLADLGTANTARLRTHPNKEIAQLAAKILDQVGSPASVEKHKLLAALTPEVEKPGGNIEKGRSLFTAACSICHKLGALGNEVGPALDGMGAHSAADLLVAVIDPNREVDPSFLAWNIVKKNGDTLAGVIAQENTTSLQLRSPAGVVEIAKDTIATRENTQRSLMPEGFEGLGAENLRDLLAFLKSTETRFRIVNLEGAYTADTRAGLFQSENNRNDTLRFAKFGTVTVGGVPFSIVDPQRTALGKNVLVLKGGPAPGVFSKSFPQKVEVPVQFEAGRLRLLSGVGGWAGARETKGKTVLSVTVVFADERTEEFPLRDGEHFADYNGHAQVPGSTEAPGLVQNGQVRLITLELKKAGFIRSLRLESADNTVAPVVVAITADADTGK
jgi:putative membrane-bound dehydrogenase-like protein